MKKIFGLILLVITLNSFGQNPTNYQYRTVRERLLSFMVDSSLHIPRYNAAPSGIRVGSSTQAGNIVIDTTNMIIWAYKNYSWYRVANINDSSVANNPSFATNLRLKKIVDSLFGAGWGNDTHFGNTNLTQTGARTYAGAGYDYTLNNLGDWTFNPASGKSLHWAGFGSGSNVLFELDGAFGVSQGGQTKIGVSSLGTELYSQNGSDGMVKIYDDNVDIQALSGKSRLYLNQVGGSRGFTLTGYASNGTDYGTIDATEGDLSIYAAHQLLLSANDSVYFDLEPAGQTPLRFRGLPQSDTATYVMGLAMTPDGKVRAVMQDKSLLGGGSQTLQQVFDEETGEALLNKNDTINAGGNEFRIQNASNLIFTATTEVDINSGSSGVNITGHHLGVNGILAGTSYFEQSEISTPSAPDPGAGRWYVGTDKKPRFIDSDGTIYDLSSTGGGGTDNANVGSGYRLVKPSTQEIKTLRGESGILLDSSSHTDEITAKIDTSFSPTKAAINKTIDSLKALGWGAQDVNFEPWYTVTNEFAGTTYDAGLYWISSGTGAAAAGQSSGLAAGWLNGLKLSTGTTNAGVAGIYDAIGPSSSYAEINLDNSVRANVGFKIRLEDLSDGTDTYVIAVGFGDEWANIPGGITDGVYFEYTHSSNSGKFYCTTESNNTKTQTDSGVTVAADTDYKLEISVYNGHAFFYINKALVADVTTNIPTGDTRRTSAICSILKSAGTNNRDMFVDWGKLGTRSN